MSDIVIKAENLGKKYIIGHQADHGRYLALRDVLTQNARGFLHKTKDLVQGKPIIQGDTLEEVWALKDVSFEIQRGEAVGIIGRNGAGKSTLLKVLSRITEPSAGRVTIKGRVASLLEVGTGFHPELTGRENIYLNGAILGMTRQEIKRKFDEIVAFAEVEKFLDTPVKRYSSGMYVRLAFAVAAHLEPEILVVDEVLAVGDAAFQKKCLGKMGEVAREGRTVLFVSHNMSAVLSLCQTCFRIDAGLLVESGMPENVVANYMNGASGKASIALSERKDRAGNGRVRLTALAITGADGHTAVRCGDRLRVSMSYAAQNEVLGATFLVGIYDHMNRPIFFLDSATAGGLPQRVPPHGTVTCDTGPINLTPGPCLVNAAVLVNGEMADHVGGVYVFDVEADDFYGTGKMTDRQTTLCLIHQDWQVQ